MSKNHDYSSAAKKFVDIIQNVSDRTVEKLDRTVVCRIESVNKNGRLNVYILPDTTTILTNIINESQYEFKPGDEGELYLIRNRPSNSYVMAKINPSENDLRSNASGSTAITNIINGGGTKGEKGDPGSVADLIVTGDGNAITNIALNQQTKVITATKDDSFIKTTELTYEDIEIGG